MSKKLFESIKQLWFIQPHELCFSTAMGCYYRNAGYQSLWEQLAFFLYLSLKQVYSPAHTIPKMNSDFGAGCINHGNGISYTLFYFKWSHSTQIHFRPVVSVDTLFISVLKNSGWYSCDGFCVDHACHWVNTSQEPTEERFNFFTDSEFSAHHGGESVAEYLESEQKQRTRACPSNPFPPQPSPSTVVPFPTIYSDVDSISG